jgi:hypothetical protein
VIFVHIADARSSASFARAGIRLPRVRPGYPTGVFAMPVLKDYFASHQWLRELKRRGARTLVGVYFRVPSSEPVLVGHYRQAHAPMTAGRAARVIMEAEDPRGYEVIVPRKIEPKAIHAIRAVHRVVGWRYYPEAKGKKPFCGCQSCTRGEIKSRRLREAYEAAFRDAR